MKYIKFLLCISSSFIVLVLFYYNVFMSAQANLLLLNAERHFDTQPEIAIANYKKVLELPLLDISGAIAIMSENTINAAYKYQQVVFHPFYNELVTLQENDLKAHPAQLFSYLRLTDFYAQTQQVDKLVMAMNSAFDLAPNRPTNYLVFSQQFAYLRMYKQAYDLLELILAIAPNADLFKYREALLQAQVQ